MPRISPLIEYKEFIIAFKMIYSFIKTTRGNLADKELTTELRALLAYGQTESIPLKIKNCVKTWAATPDSEKLSKLRRQYAEEFFEQKIPKLDRLLIAYGAKLDDKNRKDFVENKELQNVLFFLQEVSSEKYVTRRIFSELIKNPALVAALTMARQYWKAGRFVGYFSSKNKATGQHIRGEFGRNATIRLIDRLLKLPSSSDSCSLLAAVNKWVGCSDKSRLDSRAYFASRAGLYSTSTQRQGSGQQVADQKPKPCLTELQKAAPLAMLLPFAIRK